MLHALQYDNDNEFIMLLKWKDSQGLLLWIYHDVDDHDDILLPNDFGIETDDDDDNDVKSALAFDIAANIPLNNDDDEAVTNDIVSSSDMTSIGKIDRKLSLSNENNQNIPTIPFSPSLSDDKSSNFVPPLRLQRNQLNMVNRSVSDYNGTHICQTIDEDEDEEEEEKSFKFKMLTDDDDDDKDIDSDDLDDDSESEDDDFMVDFNIDDIESEDDDINDNNIITCTNNNVSATPSSPSNANIIVHDIWKDLSDKLSNIYDPFNSLNYNKLILDNKWWNNSFDQSVINKNHYGATKKDIINELVYAEMNYRSVMEILFQSNPSLIPCKTFRDIENVSITTHSQPRPKKLEIAEINFMPSNTTSTVCSSGDDDFDNEFSQQFETWMVDDYDHPNNWRKY